jgi:hypothetical protein
MKDNKTGAATNEPKTDSTERTAPKKWKSAAKTFGRISLAAVALVLLGIVGPTLRGDDGKHSDAHWKTIVIDIANDSRTAVPSPSVPGPKRGDTFIVNAKIYPGGTIPAGNGVDIDSLSGSIGTCITRGTFNFDFSQILAGART